MDLKQLGLFVRVVDAGGFGRAAAQMHLTQSTMSRQVGLLEKDLGQRLLTRTGRGVEPTEAGQALYNHAQSIIELADRARADLRELDASPRGRVTVGLPPRVSQVLTTPLVERFRERFPRAVITVAEGLSLTLREWLIGGRIDLALLFDPPAAPQLDCRLLSREPLILVGPHNQAKLPARVSVAYLAELPLLLPSAPNAIRSLVDAAARPKGLSLQVVAEVDAVHSVLSLVAGGVGYTVLPESSVASSQHRPRLQTARIGPPTMLNRLVLAQPRARPLTRLMRETARLLAELDFVAMSRRGRN